MIDIHDRTTAAWRRPVTRVKTKNDHIVPLSSMAFDTVHETLELIEDEAPFLFPSPVDRDKPIDGHALARAMSRLALSEHLDGPGSNTWKAAPPTPHDLRRTCETRMSALGVPKEDRDVCLNHARNDIGSRHYDMYDRFEEKKLAFTKLSNHLHQVLST